MDFECCLSWSVIRLSFIAYPHELLVEGECTLFCLCHLCIESYFVH